MRTLALSMVLILASLPLMARHVGAYAEYVGGTCAEIESNQSGNIQTLDKTYFIFVAKKAQVKIPYERINLLEYGQKVSRRYVEAIFLSPLLFMAKKRQHFLTVGFQDENGQQQELVFRIEKNDVRLALVSLEARTGQQIQYQDDEARAAGKE